MTDYGFSEEHQPLTWWKGYPVYTAHAVVGVLVASLLVTTGLMAFRTSEIAAAMLSWLPFTSEGVFAGQFWRIFSYGFYNPPSLWFVVEMAMIVWFGRELERAFGRRAFLRFYLGLYFLLPFLFLLLGLWWPTRLAGESGGFALFIAFATLHPNAPMFFGLLTKWIAAILVGIYTLMAISQNDVVSLLTLWVSVGFAFAFVRQQQGVFALPKLRLPSRKPKLRVLPGGATSNPAPTPRRESPEMAEIDALLDKIARSGLASLTREERAKLDAGREHLRQRDSRSR